MEKKTKIIIASVVGAIAVAFLISKIVKKKAIVPDVGNSGSDVNSSVMTDEFPLHRGSKGNNVKALQVALNKKLAILVGAMAFGDDSLTKGGLKITDVPIKVDGIFGKNTLASTKIVLGKDSAMQTDIDFLNKA
jgi:hypothetical protein